MNHFTQTAGSVEEKNLKMRVDSERGKRNIRHLATVSESRVALLFNNLSDNLCGHSKTWILKRRKTLNEYQVSGVNIRNSLRSLILRASNLN